MTEKPSRNEEEYFAKREAEILRARRAAAERVALEAERRSHYLKCPKCGGDLVSEDYQGVQIERCPEDGGIWLDAGELEALRARGGESVVGTLKAIMRGLSGG